LNSSVIQSGYPEISLVIIPSLERQSWVRVEELT